MAASVLAATHHDPESRLCAQTTRVLERIGALYSTLAVVVTPQTPEAALAPLHTAGVVLEVGSADEPVGLRYLGRWRRRALEVALAAAPEASHLHFCDFDRLLHWAEYYPDELQRTLTALPAHDFCVLGRTVRAFATHPRVQRDTEALINHVFALASGLQWDVTAASRGLSRRAAEHILAACPDDTIGTDCSWTLGVQQQGLTMQYLATEGLEFETLDRYSDQIATLGGSAAWIARCDADPTQWAQRTELASLEIQAIATYATVS